MNRFSRFGRRRESVRRSAHSIAAAVLSVLLVAMLASAAVMGHAPGVARAQAATPVTASVTPESALIYIAIDLDTQSPQYQKATELLQRVGVDTSVEDLAGDISSSMTGGNTTEASELQAFLGGEVGVAVFDFGDMSSLSGDLGSEGDETGDDTPAAVPAPSTAIIVSAPDPDAAFAAAENAFQQDATDQGATVSEDSYEGVLIKSVPGDVTSDTTGSSLARVGDFVVIGTTPADIEPIVDTQSGKTPALADGAEFKSVSAELNADWIVFGHINGTELADQLSSATEASGVNVSTIELAQLQADSGFVVWADDPGFRIDSITMPATGGNVTQAANFDAQLPTKIPGDALFFTDGAELGKSGFLDTIFLALLTSMTGSVGTDIATPDPSKSAEQIAQEQFAQLELLLGFNLKTDFIDQMIGEWGMAAWGIDSSLMSSQDTSGVRFLLVSDVQTPETVSNAATKLSTLIQTSLAGQGTLSTKAVGQDQVNVLTMESTTGGAPTTIEYGIVGGQFIISVNDAVSDYVSGVDSALADNPNYQAALAELPAEHNGIFYLDVATVVQLVQEAIAAFSAGMETTDASEKCAEYSTQEAAQEAFDADQATNWELDQDFDGEACEDYFNPSSAEPIPSPASDQYAALKTFASVTFERDGMSGVSALLLIQE
ncbi:MAG: hypothetical protein QOF33_1082 [Thermomicrobiales bacterium]|nr:hypothetical protein [Thermomicrobiales bacterium]